LTNSDAVRDIESAMTPRTLKIRSNLAHAYQSVYTADVTNALEELARFDADRKAAMAARIERRAARARNQERIAFLDQRTTIPRTFDAAFMPRAALCMPGWVIAPEKNEAQTSRIDRRKPGSSAAPGVASNCCERPIHSLSITSWRRRHGPMCNMCNLVRRS
jgi:hypothetical protein